MLSELDGFFKAVGKETRRAVQEVYPDVVGAQLLLRYETVDAGCCRVLLHPRWRSRCYPTTAFTTADVATVKRLLGLGTADKDAFKDVPAFAALDTRVGAGVETDVGTGVDSFVPLAGPEDAHADADAVR